MMMLLMMILYTYVYTYILGIYVYRDFRLYQKAPLALPKGPIGARLQRAAALHEHLHLRHALHLEGPHHGLQRVFDLLLSQLVVALPLIQVFLARA